MNASRWTRRGKGRPSTEPKAPADAWFVVYCDDSSATVRVQGRDNAYAETLLQLSQRKQDIKTPLACGFMLESKWKEKEITDGSQR